MWAKLSRILPYVILYGPIVLETASKVLKAIDDQVQKEEAEIIPLPGRNAETEA